MIHLSKVQNTDKLMSSNDSAAQRIAGAEYVCSDKEDSAQPRDLEKAFEWSGTKLKELFASGTTVQYFCGSGVRLTCGGETCRVVFGHHLFALHSSLSNSF